MVMGIYYSYECVIGSQQALSCTLINADCVTVVNTHCLLSDIIYSYFVIQHIMSYPNISMDLFSII